MSPLLNNFISGKVTKINHKICLENEQNKIPKSAVDPLKYEWLGEAGAWHRLILYSLSWVTPAES